MSFQRNPDVRSGSWSCENPNSCRERRKFWKRLRIGRVKSYCAQMHRCLSRELYSLRFAMQVRQAKVEDADEACAVLRRSIAELCQADHRDDPHTLGAWLSNKTADNVSSWIVGPTTHVVVAIEGAAIIGVGAITSSGEITLNYVSPAARFRGVSKAVLKWLEAKALELGNVRCTLKSTKTARRFYLSSGYVQQGSPTGSFARITCYPMVKEFSSTARAV